MVEKIVARVWLEKPYSFCKLLDFFPQVLCSTGVLQGGKMSKKSVAEV
jgi:hypothetical protein